MRTIAFLAAAAFLVAAGSAVACPMQKSQTVASNAGNSTPIPAKGQQANEG